MKKIRNTFVLMVVLLGTGVVGFACDYTSSHLAIVNSKIYWVTVCYVGGFPASKTYQQIGW
jgi:hypothetical protein